MRVAFFSACGGLYSVFNTVVYTLGQLNSAASLGIVPDDYKEALSSTSGQCVLGVTGLFNVLMLASLVNTYVKKATRRYGKKEIQALPPQVAAVTAAAGALDKAVTSNVSAGLAVSALVLKLASLKWNMYLGAQLGVKIASILLVKVLCMPSTFFVHNAIGYNEAAKGSAKPKPSGFMQGLLRRIDRMWSTAVHAVIADTPSNLMYVLEGHEFTEFVVRFAMGASQSSFSLAAGWATLSIIAHLCCVVPMEVSYNVQYEKEIKQCRQGMELVQAGAYRAMEDDNKGCLSKQNRLVERHPKAINNSSAFYKSVITTTSAFMLAYQLAADDAKFEQGEIEWPALGVALSVAVLVMIVCYVANRSFLSDKPSNQPSQPQPQPRDPQLDERDAAFAAACNA